jgi:16S rRNA (cytosine1402-N4)-methyltransferase
MSLHVPVLLRPVSRLIFSVTSSPRVLDLTLGTGGYSSAFLEEQGGCRVVGVDRDPSQVATVDRLSRRFGERFSGLCPRTWSSLRDQLEPESFDAVVADLGLCTTQLEDISRGFSFRGKDMDALDMRMSNEGPTAADLLNTMSESDMIAMFAQLGQEPLQRARAIASRIVSFARFLLLFLLAPFSF